MNPLPFEVRKGATLPYEAWTLLNSPKVMVAYRMPLRLELALQQAARAGGRTKSDVLREALLAHLGVPPPHPHGCVVTWLEEKTFERLKHRARSTRRTIADIAAVLLVQGIHRR